jgi:predicted dehydrogenase
MFKEPTQALPKIVVAPGDFKFAAAYLEHPHLWGQIKGLIEAGGKLTWIYTPEPSHLKELQQQFPEARVARSFDEILDSDVQLVTAAAIPNQRAAIGCRVMQAGKDYFTAKCPVTTLEQLKTVRQCAEVTGRKYMVFYNERLNSEATCYADQLIQEGAIGDIVHMEIFGPHRLRPKTRADWFFKKEQYGGILADIASHQFDQFLYHTRCSNGSIAHARVNNVANPHHPEFEDVGQAVLILENGVQCFSRVNWLTPDGMRSWGDGRSFITGTTGVIEIRKYFDFGRSNEGDQLIIANHQGEHLVKVRGKIGHPFFGQLILDCLNRTENAMTQAHALQAAHLSLQAQAVADANRR